MKCAKIESLIYLYNELDEREKLYVDVHKDGCASCRSLFVQRGQQHIWIREVGAMPVLAASPPRIKRNIMQAIEANKENSFTEIINIVTMYWLRASLAIASILIAGLFFAQRSADYSRTVLNSTNSVSNGIRLNTPQFLKAHLKRRESANQISFYDCLKQSDSEFLKNLKAN
ncbi:MAG: zf-HC2 domain-containing protein [Cyclobacteriaceae bacterium]|nr:zf-HC2 domain-containing protein [Cyclobacteriaceae bacterium]